MNNGVSIAKLLLLLSALKQSKILQFIIEDPYEQNVLLCAHKLVRNDNTIPKSFLPKLVSILRAPVTTLDPLNPNVSHYKVIVAVENTEPPKKVTKMTKETKTKALNSDLINAHVVPSPNITDKCFNMYKLIYDDTTVDNIVNAIGDLQQVHNTGYKSNGYLGADYVPYEIANNNC